MRPTLRPNRKNSFRHHPGERGKRIGFKGSRSRADKGISNCKLQNAKGKFSGKNHRFFKRLTKVLRFLAPRALRLAPDGLNALSYASF